MDPLSEIARAVLYEGYILWPYRRTAMKNQQRWTFGGVYPRAYSVVMGGTDRWQTCTECLVEAEPGANVDASVDARVRYLQVVQRQVMRDVAGVLEPVDEITVRGERYVTWEEAVEREVIAPAVVLASAEWERTDDAGPRSCEVSIAIAAGSDTEPLLDADGQRAGAIVRSWAAIEGALGVHVESVGQDGLFRVQVTVTNTSDWAGGPRTEALRHTLVSTHSILHVQNGAFVSLMDPGAVHAESAAACRNEGMWPVLVGEEGARDTMLSSPIILYDYPRIAPESPGDLFDGGEIDQLLILNILTLTDEEKQEMRDSDPRAREILDRCMSLPPDELMRLHGTVRSLMPLRQEYGMGEA